ncbi:YcxB family protein [Streptomyces sp. SP18CS02]|uniref:YcxB family protein n=1 Tax=Streptomyces sp. SP18CS02 TaxID=3002531 RepID=UPI002E796042|nr:YcxB family protein [Streptomyces sp. SP18CS02]MEE1754001.1 YcxB family protein [Streptomyces sp. SP18CS02]
MAECRCAEGTDNSAENADDGVDERTGVQLVYQPRSADALVGLRIRERIKRTGLVLRMAFLALWVGHWLLSVVGRGSVDVVSTVLFLFVVLALWGYPRLQAAHVQRIVAWQGQYRATVSAAGITCRTDHSTLIQQWTVFRGYRETAGHFVLLSRDPNVMCLDVLPKRGAQEAGDVDRLRALLDRYTTRV